MFSVFKSMPFVVRKKKKFKKKKKKKICCCCRCMFVYLELGMVGVKSLEAAVHRSLPGNLLQHKT
jgi:hypothetical protein